MKELISLLLCVVTFLSYYERRITVADTRRQVTKIVLLAIILILMHVSSDENIRSIDVTPMTTNTPPTYPQALVTYPPKPKENERCDEYTIALSQQEKLFSQYGQDNVLYRIFENYEGGFFVDLAACWPKRLSNTYFLETCMDWSGICIEADARKVIDLVKERTCRVAPECVTRERQIVNFGSSEIIGTNGINDHAVAGSVNMTCDPLNVVLERYGSPQHIDYMSLDIEGAEAGALESIGNYVVDLITLELFHIRSDPHSVDVVKRFLKNNDYVPVIGFPTNKNNVCNGHPGNDIWDKPIDELFGDLYLHNRKYRMATHDVLFIRRGSRHFDKTKRIFSC
jgi:hypothetical protein